MCVCVCVSLLGDARGCVALRLFYIALSCCAVIYLFAIMPSSLACTFQAPYTHFGTTRRPRTHVHVNKCTSYVRSRRMWRTSTPCVMTIAAVCTSTNLRGRSVVAMRGLSDAAWCTILHELSMRVMVGWSMVGLQETQLALGGLVGIWTAAAFAARIRAAQSRIISQSAALPENWDYSFVSAIAPEDVHNVIAWLCALDEMEGARTTQMLWEVARSETVDMRLALANAIAEFPVRANSITAILYKLSNDSDPNVKMAAENAHMALIEEGILPSLSEDTSLPDALAQAAAEFNEYDENDEYETDVNAWLYEEFIRAIDQLSNAALWRTATKERPQTKRRLKVPLFDGLQWSEIHGLCTLAALPLAYEVYSLFDGGNLPLRFVGLGWLFTVAGLVAYPRSGMLWRKIQHACAVDANAYRHL